MTADALALARELADLRRRMEALERSTQLGHSSVVVDGEDVTLTAALAAALDAQVTAAEALDAASTAEAKADGRVQTFYGGEPPSPDEVDLGPGDFWSDDNGDAFSWDGADWQPVTSTAVSEALDAARNAEAAADGKITTFYADRADPPTAEAVGDLWFVTDEDNLLNRWDGAAWLSVRDGGIVEAVETANDAASTASAASQAAEDARQVAADAQAAADAAASTAASAAETAADAQQVGDAANTAANNITATQITDDAILARHITADAVTARAIAAEAVTAGKIAANAVTAGTIEAEAVTAGKIAANAVTAGTIEADAVTARALAADAVTAEAISADALDGKVITGALIRTAPEGESRIEIGADRANSVLAYSELPVEVQPGGMTVTGQVSDFIFGSLVLSSPDLGNGPAFLSLTAAPPVGYDEWSDGTTAAYITADRGDVGPFGWITNEATGNVEAQVLRLQRGMGAARGTNYASRYRATAIAIPSGAWRTLPYETSTANPDVEDDGPISPDGSTFASWAPGVFLMTATCAWSSNTSGYRSIRIVTEGGSVIRREGVAISVTPFRDSSVTAGFFLPGGGYSVRVEVFQNSGVTLNVLANQSDAPGFARFTQVA